MTSVNIKLGDLVKDARLKKGLSIRQVERLTGISNAYLGQIERGEVKEPSPNKLLKLSEHLNVSYQSLMEAAGYVMPTDSSYKRASNTNHMFLLEEDLNEQEAKALQDFLKTLRSWQNSSQPQA